MLIAFDAKRYFFNRTGLGNYSRRWIQLLAERSRDTELLLCSPKMPPPDLVLPQHSRLLTPQRNAFMFREWFISAQINRAQADVYHGLSNELPLSAASMRCRKLVSIHDLIFRRFPSYYRLPDRVIYDTKSRFACTHADLIVATSQATANDIQRYYKTPASRIRVVYQDVDPDFFSLPERTFERRIAEPYFLFVSSFTARKNHALLIEALHRIRKQNDHHLVLAGAAGPTLSQCISLAQSLGLAQRVHFLPNCSKEDLMTLYRHADGFLLPSLFEGFGIPLAEAMAAQIPCAASDISVFRELGGEACLYFDPNERDAAAEAMLRLLMPEQRTTLLEVQKVRSSLFSADVLWKQMKELYGIG